MAVLLLFTISAFAGKVDEQQALQKAKAFLKTTNVTAASKQIQTAFKAPRKGKTTEEPCYYVFNVDDSKGFVIVSADDRTEEILGYVEKGSFDPNNIPENMKAFLQNYEDEMKWLDDNNTITETNKQKKAPTTTVSPLLTSEWSQSSPYNDLCPLQNGARSVTGCVATAISQILFYHKWPQESTASVQGYTCRNGVVVNDLPPTTFSWNDMTDTYDYLSSTNSKKAVAKLMQYVGAALHMEYSSAASGASSEGIPNALQDIFGYSESTRLLYRPNFSISEWDSIITNELTNNRPIYYSGYTAKMEGHAFVCDGRRADGMFHINWGWGGYYDGYFRLSLLNPSEQGIGGSESGMKFSNMQSIIIGISPNVIDNIYTPENKVTTGYMSLKNGRTYTRNNASTDFSGITITMPITADGDHTSYYTYIEYGLALYKNGTWVKNLTTQSGYALLSLYINYDDVMKEMYVSFGADLEDGTYQIVPISRSYSTNTWERAIGSERNYIDAVINGNEMTLTIMPKADFDVTNIVYEKNYLKADINNISEEYNGFIYLFTDTEADMGKEYVAIPANSADNFELYIDPQKYSFSLDKIFYLSTDYYRTEFFYSSGSNENASLSNTINLRNSNVDNTCVYGNKVMYGLNINNTGTGAYNYHIICELVQADNNQVVISNKMKENIPAMTSKTMEYEFKLNSTQLGKDYFIRVIHYNGKTEMATTTSSFNVAQGVVYWDANGTISVQPSEATITIPENAVAANLRNAGTQNFVPNSNPNTIYLLNTSIPTSLKGKNVVNSSSGTGSIELTDGYSYFIPEDISISQQVTYKRTFTQEENGGWSTIALPFTPTTLSNDTDGSTITIKQNNEDANGSLWMMALTAVNNGEMDFGYPVSLEANTPYIISVTSNLVGKQVTFSQGKCKLEASKATSTTCGDYVFNGSTSVQSLNNVFMLSGGNKFVYTTNATVAPFRAYVTGPDTYTELKINSDSHLTSIDVPTVLDNSSSANDIYTLSGLKVGNDIKQLPKGIYIVNGKKLIIK